MYQLNGVRTPQNRQLIVLISKFQQQVDDLAGKLTLLNHLMNTLCEIGTDLGAPLGVGGSDRGRGEQRHAHHHAVRPCVTLVFQALLFLITLEPRVE
jgi:hypothetical protein